MVLITKTKGLVLQMAGRTFEPGVNGSKADCKHSCVLPVILWLCN